VIVGDGTAADVDVNKLMHGVPVDQLTVDTEAAQTPVEKVSCQRRLLLVSEDCHIKSQHITEQLSTRELGGQNPPTRANCPPTQAFGQNGLIDYFEQKNAWS